MPTGARRPGQSSVFVFLSFGAFGPARRFPNRRLNENWTLQLARALPAAAATHPCHPRLAAPHLWPHTRGRCRARLIERQQHAHSAEERGSPPRIAKDKAQHAACKTDATPALEPCRLRGESGDVQWGCCAGPASWTAGPDGSLRRTARRQRSGRGVPAALLEGPLHPLRPCRHWCVFASILSI